MTCSGPELAQHIWVQVANGADWQDLDPSIPGQVSGQSLTTVQGTADTLADELHHTVELSVVAENVSGGALAEKTLLSVTRTGEDLANTPVVMVNVDPAGLKAIGVDIAGGLDGWRSYVAVLGIGDEGWTSSGFVQFAHRQRPLPTLRAGPGGRDHGRVVAADHRTSRA